MGRNRKRMQITAFVAMMLLCSVAWTATGTQATVLTNLGGVAEGTLSGLGPLIQLRAPHGVQVTGPHQQFDLPLSRIRQITVDFPRVIIETLEDVIIAPYSAFLGIAEILTLTPGRAEETYRIPFTSVRAIALHGAALRPVPRQWMGDHFLSEPEIAAARPLGIEICADCEVTTPTPSAVTPAPVDDSPVIWGAFTPEVPEEEPSFPWWIGLVAVAVLLGVFFIVSPGS
jgi:hypothetical protein